MKYERSVWLPNASSVIRLLSCSLVSYAAHDVCSFWRCRSVTFPPETVER